MMQRRRQHPLMHFHVPHFVRLARVLSLNRKPLVQHKALHWRIHFSSHTTDLTCPPIRCVHHPRPYPHLVPHTPLLSCSHTSIFPPPATTSPSPCRYLSLPLSPSSLPLPPTLPPPAPHRPSPAPTPPSSAAQQGRQPSSSPLPRPTAGREPHSGSWRGQREGWRNGGER